MRMQRSILLVFVWVLVCPWLIAQRTLDQLQSTLIGKPLYLRGLWIGNKLEFSSDGSLQGSPDKGPLSLSGIDLLSVSVKGKDLSLHGRRVALVSNAEGRLERRLIYSTTIIFGSLRRKPNDRYLAYQEVNMLIHPDSQGGFDTALLAVFANGLAELASSAPPYWTCYARGYFLERTDAESSDKKVADCVQERTLAHADPNWALTEGLTPPSILSAANPRVTAFAQELRVHGLSRVHFTVSRNGVPAGFQIVKAVGGGMDEETLRAVSAFKFQPGLRNAQPVPADLDFQMEYVIAP